MKMCAVFVDEVISLCYNLQCSIIYNISKLYLFNFFVHMDGEMMKYTKILIGRIGCSVVSLLMAVTFLVGCSAKEESDVTQTTENTKTETIITGSGASSADLYCLEFTTFSGAFVEDGKNEKVENVAAILVENRSESFLDRATITYKYGDKDAVFLLTGLPAGKKCWVMEQNKLVLDGKHSFEFVKCVTAFKEDVTLVTDELTLVNEDNAITVSNISGKKLSNVCVYYKNTLDDGNYFGGITYMINFDSMEPGDSFTKESAHFSDSSKVVRYSYQAE